MISLTSKIRTYHFVNEEMQNKIYGLLQPDFHVRDEKRRQASGILSTFKGELSESGRN